MRRVRPAWLAHSRPPLEAAQVGLVASPASNIVSISGNGEIQGAIDVDGKGTVALGSSHTNLVYDPRGFNQIKTYAGAAPTPNTFRVLPGGQ